MLSAELKGTDKLSSFEIVALYQSFIKEYDIKGFKLYDVLFFEQDTETKPETKPDFIETTFQTKNPIESKLTTEEQKSAEAYINAKKTEKNAKKTEALKNELLTLEVNDVNKNKQLWPGGSSTMPKYILQRSLWPLHLPRGSFPVN